MTSAARPPGAPEPKPRSRLGRLFRRSRFADVSAPVDEATLQLLGQAFDPVRGDAVVLEEIAAAGTDLTRPVVLRHVFAVHDSASAGSASDDGGGVDALTGGLEADGYAVGRPEPARLTASATVLLTPMSAAQARARMTGLTTRYPVDYLGWEALGPDS